MGGEELKWRHLARNQLMSQQGPHFSAHSTAKTNDKSTILRKNDWCLEKTLSDGCQKLTSAKKLRLEK